MPYIAFDAHKKSTLASVEDRGEGPVRGAAGHQREAIRRLLAE